MTLTKSKSNMYDWCTPWNSLAGECPHKCVYCSTKSIPWKSVREKYSGELRLDEKAMQKNLGKGNTWFVCAQNDLWAEKVMGSCIVSVIGHCNKYPENTYIFQTKNPNRYHLFESRVPENSIFGCTIESTSNYGISHAPVPYERMLAMEILKARKFITIEPIIDFDLNILSDWIKRIKPEFVNIGADSKGHKLPEPPPDKIKALIAEIQKAGIEIREKHNLERLLK